MERVAQAGTAVDDVGGRGAAQGSPGSPGAPISYTLRDDGMELVSSRDGATQKIHGSYNPASASFLLVIQCANVGEPLDHVSLPAELLSSLQARGAELVTVAHTIPGVGAIAYLQASLDSWLSHGVFESCPEGRCYRLRVQRMRKLDADEVQAMAADCKPRLPHLVETDEMARILGIHPETLKRHRREGRLRALPVGPRKIMWDVDDVLSQLRELENETRAGGTNRDEDEDQDTGGS